MISFTNQLLIGLIFKVLWLYLNQSFIFLKMLTSISMYLFHISVHIGFRMVRTQFKVYVKFKRMKEFNESQLKVELRIYCIKLAPSSIGLSKQMRFFGISLAYSHSVSFRLLYGLMEINPVFRSPNSLLICLTFNPMLLQ